MYKKKYQDNLSLELQFIQNTIATNIYEAYCINA